MPANTIITVRKGSSSAWVSANPVLASGELGFDTTNNILKIGNGTSDWNSLSNHRHSSADITNFNSSVSGLLPVKDVVASSGINISSVSGIYTISSPGNFSTLQVNGTGVVASSGGNSGYLSKFTASNTIDDSIIYQSSGNIGINTTNPSYQLDVSGSIRTLRSDANEFLYYERSGVGNGGLAISASATTFRSSLPYRFIVGANEHVRIDSSGNVGIGTTTPSGKLHIGSGDLHFDSGYGLRWAGGSRLYEERFGVAGGSTERMLYLPNGDRFEVVTENGVNFIAGFHGANSLLTNSIRLYRAVGIGSNYAASGSLPVNGLAVQGNVGIGVQSPIAPLHVIGSGVYSTSDSSSIITIDPSGRSIDCNPSAFSDISLKANNQFIFRGLDGWTGTWSDSAITTYFQVGRNAGSTIFTSLQGAPFTRLAYSANKILFTNSNSNLSIPSGHFTINANINGGSVGTSGLVIDTTHSSSAANGQSHGALVITPLFNTVGSNLNNIYGAYIAPRHSGVYTTTNSYGLYVNAATNISGTITNNYAAVFNGGNVGIGTLSPSARLHTSIDDGNSILLLNRTSTFAGLSLDFTGNLSNLRSYYGLKIFTGSTTANAGTERVHFTDAGLVGIGTPTPSGRLDVAGDVYVRGTGNNLGTIYIKSSASTDTSLKLRSDSQGNLFLDAGAYIKVGNQDGTAMVQGYTGPVTIGHLSNSNNNQNIIFNPRAIERARLTHDGNFGIGISAPSGQLHVLGTGIISSRLGIGTNNPSVPLEVAGNAFIDGNLVFDSFTESVVTIGNSSSGVVLNIGSGTVQTCTLTNNCVFTMPATIAGKSFTMFLNTGSGNYTANFSGVLWSDSAPPTITTTPSKVDILSFISDGTYWYGSYSQNYG